MGVRALAGNAEHAGDDDLRRIDVAIDGCIASLGTSGFKVALARYYEAVGRLHPDNALVQQLRAQSLWYRR